MENQRASQGITKTTKKWGFIICTIVGVLLISIIYCLWSHFNNQNIPNILNIINKGNFNINKNSVDSPENRDGKNEFVNNSVGVDPVIQSNGRQNNNNSNESQQSTDNLQQNEVESNFHSQIPENLDHEVPFKFNKWDSDDSLIILMCFQMLFNTEEFREYLQKTHTPLNSIASILRNCANKYSRPEDLLKAGGEIEKVVDKLPTVNSYDLAGEIVKELLKLLENEIGEFEDLKMIKYPKKENNETVIGKETKEYRIPNILKLESEIPINITQLLIHRYQLSLSKEMLKTTGGINRIEDLTIKGSQYIPGKLILLNFYGIGEISIPEFLKRTKNLALPEGDYELVSFISCHPSGNTLCISIDRNQNLFNVGDGKTFVRKIYNEENTLQDNMIAPGLCLFRKK